jgi:hypothetical protein
MLDEAKTKDQLIKELSTLRRQVAQLQAGGDPLTPDEPARSDGEANYRLLIKNLPKDQGSENILGTGVGRS